MIITKSCPGGRTLAVSLRQLSAVLLVTLLALVSRPAHGATPTLKLTAYSIDGVNTGTCRLGRGVSVLTNVTGVSNTAVEWTLHGPGTLNSAGLYEAPQLMPSNTAVSVTVTATLVAAPSVSTSYQFVLIHPLPAVATVSPSSVAKGSAAVPVVITGSGFDQQSVIQLNGVAVPTIYQSPVQLTAQVSLSSTASGVLPIVVANPTPGGGGGASNVMSVAVAAAVQPTIKLTAYTIDGTNTGTDRLGRGASVVAAVSGTTNTTINWTLSGAGTLSSTGQYEAPATMPSNANVTVTATLASNPAVTSKYSLVLVNPVPFLTSISPTAVTGTSNVITLSCGNIVPGATVLVNGTAVPTTIVTPYKVTAVVPATPGQTTPDSLTIQNPAPGGGVSSAVSLTVTVPSSLTVSPATFGPGSLSMTVTGTDFTSATQVFVNGEAVPTTYVSATKLTASAFIPPWINTSVSVGVGGSGSPAVSITVPVSNKTAVTYDAAARFSMQAAYGPRPDIVAQIQNGGFQAFLTQQFAQPASVYPVPVSENAPQLQFMTNALTANNLLRQRVAFAFEELFSVGLYEGNAGATGIPWQELMEKDAFGNFRTMMNDVTLNTTMGMWLNLANNYAATTANSHPNQNYARELLQLYTIGPVTLNDDGSEVTDSSGNPVPTYNDSTVMDLSRALTGWLLPPATNPRFVLANTDFSLPMNPVDQLHDHGQKTLFGSTNLPAGQNIQEDLKQALDTVFDHPNVPPFISKQLIQHLVKSDPSPAYIERISHVFENDGTGVRGNLQAVVSAILLDPEARAGDSGTVAASDGHLQEPMLYFFAVMNGLGTAPTTTNYVSAEGALGENLWLPESVFSYFSPSFLIPGTSTNAPEFQLYDGNLMVQRSQILYNIIKGTQYGFLPGPVQSGWLMSHFSSVPDLLNAINHIYYHGTMPAATTSAIESYCATIPDLYTQQLRAIYLALNTDTFQISH